MHAENCVVLRVTARGNQTRGKDAKSGRLLSRRRVGGGLAVAEGSFTCWRCAPFFSAVVYFTFASRICRRLAPVQGEECRWGGRRFAEQSAGWDLRVVLFANMLPIRRRIDVCLLFDVAAVAAAVVVVVVNSST